MEKCDKCGKTGEDRRTLWMACFYAMDELPVPFKQVAIRGVHQDHISDEESSFFKGIKRPIFKDTPECEERQYRFYTLRVCKECRASWMDAISAWFSQSGKRDATGTGVFGRKNGAAYEMTEEEIKAKWGFLEVIEKLPETP